MARLVHQLTEAKIRTLTDVGLHADGAGLYLQIRLGGARSLVSAPSPISRVRPFSLKR